MASDPPARIIAWQRGEEAAVRALFEEYYPSAVRIAALSGLASDQAQDCAQSAFVRAYEQRRQLRDPIAFPLWFHRILSRTILRCIQERQAHPMHSLDVAGEIVEDWQRRHAPQPDEMMVAAEDRAHLWQQIQSLAPRVRMMLILHYYRGYSVREVANIVEAREGSVRVAMHRAVHQLRAQLQSAALDQPSPTPEKEPLTSIGSEKDA